MAVTVTVGRGEGVRPPPARHCRFAMDQQCRWRKQWLSIELGWKLPDVGFAPKSGHAGVSRRRPLSARSGLKAIDLYQCYFHKCGHTDLWTNKKSAANRRLGVASRRFKITSRHFRSEAHDQSYWHREAGH